jgi:hypothetical protein
MTPVGLGETDRTLNVACRMLVEAEAPIGTAALAAELGEPEAAVAALVADYEKLGRMKRDGSEVVASLGLSAVPDEYEIRSGTRRMWAWCAKSGVGVVSVLGRPGSVSGRSPASGMPLTVTFDGSGRFSEDLVVFWPDDTFRASCGSAKRDYCPAFALLDDQPTAQSWASSRGFSGEVLIMTEAVSRATAYWLPILGPGDRAAQSRA